MEKACRVAVIVVGLLTLLGALGFMFNPAQMEARFSVLPTRLDGWGTLRADLGGALLGLACFIFMGARAGHGQWLLVPVITTLGFLLGRIVHIVVDGISSPAIASLVVEFVLLFIMEGSRRVLTQGEQAAKVAA